MLITLTEAATYYTNTTNLAGSCVTFPTVTLYLMLRDGIGGDGMGKHGLLGLWMLASMPGESEMASSPPRTRQEKRVLIVRRLCFGFANKH